MAATAFSPRRLSPWAARFGLSDASKDPVFNADDLRHSGFAPEMPTQDPIYYGDDFGPLATWKPYTYEERDRFFLAEKQFIVVTKGMRPWQLGPPNLWTKFTANDKIPGGHRQANPSRILTPGEVIEPDESTWLPFLRRDRWYDYSYAQDPDFGKDFWSVDQPRVWAELSIVLELVNRMLLALIQDKHSILHTMLYGWFGRWTKGAKLLGQEDTIPKGPDGALVLISNTMIEQHRDVCDKELRVILNREPTRTSTEYRKELESLLENVSWGFLEPSRGSFATSEFRKEGRADSCIGIRTALLRALIQWEEPGRELTLAERCHLQYQQAVVCLHEIGHIIVFARRKRLDLDWRYFSEEPFFDFRGRAEVGFALDAAVHGGNINMPLIDTGVPLFMSCMDWPSPVAGGNDDVQGHPDFANGRMLQNVLITSDYTSKLLSSEFWNDDAAVPRKSDHFFHRDSLFATRTGYGSGTGSFWQYSQEMDVDVMRDQATLNEVERDMVRNWNERRQLWHAGQAAWYDTAKKDWDRSPWTYRQIRLWISEFAEAFEKEDSLLCGQYAGYLNRGVKWENGTDVEYLTSVYPRWYFHLIALLMMAAIPLQDDDETDERRATDLIHKLRPSKTAKSLRRRNFEASIGDADKTITRRKSRFRNPLRPDEVVDKLTQMDYIRQAGDVLKRLASRKTKEPWVSGPWLDEITRVYGMMKRERRQMERSMGRDRHVTQFVPKWDLKVPKYDPFDNVVWDEEREDWV